jgi:hypothetical protein
VKPTVYLETTIISYLAARPSRDLVTAAHQQITREWWEQARDRFEVFISPVVLEEISRGDATAAGIRQEIVVSFPLSLLQRGTAWNIFSRGTVRT